jgi:hypothetical protein
LDVTEKNPKQVKVSLVKLDSYPMEQLEFFVRTVHLLLKDLKTGQQLIDFLVNKKVVPDLTTVRKVHILLVGRPKLNFKKITRILLTLVPNMVLLTKQFFDNKTKLKQMKRY